MGFFCVLCVARAIGSFRHTVCAATKCPNARGRRARAPAAGGPRARPRARRRRDAADRDARPATRGRARTTAPRARAQRASRWDATRRRRAMGRRRPATAARAIVGAVLALASVAVPARGAFSVMPSTGTGTTVTYAGTAAFRERVVDACGTCGGDGAACQGCDGVTNSGKVFDACGACGTACDKSDTSITCTFNATCEDCASVTGGAATTDACGNCKAPTDATFSREGVPDHHLGGCVGCDGVANSGAVMDVCGVCGGNGCSGTDPSLWSWCCDCAGVAFGTSTQDLCCECVDGASYYPNGVKPAEHTQIENLWTQGQEAFAAAAATMTTFRALVEPRHKAAAQTLYEQAEQAFKDAWALVATQAAVPGTTMCYPELTALPQVTNNRDACGVCKGQLSSCLGCATSATPLPVGPLEGLYPDDCDVCGGSTEVDVCGICGGSSNGLDCVGCDGIVASGKVQDACYDSDDTRMYSIDAVSGAKTLLVQVGEVGSGCSDPDAFITACAAGGGGCCGCDGVPNSGKTLDACGSCLAADATDRKTNANACEEIFLVKLPSGVVIGPFTKEQIRGGSLTYTESSTNTETIYTIEPDSQIANAAVIDVTESVEYGYTSVEQEYLDSWQSIFVSGRADVISSTSVPNTVNTVVVTGSRVTNTSEYQALQVKPEFVGVIYPFCTGATYRAGHRLHGKKTGSNYLGIITTSASMPEDWTEAQSRLDRDWNPYSERVLDYVAEWADQRCTCVADWRTEPEPVPPTCERVWLQASEEKKSSKMERSWASGSWRVTGGWWTQDFGQKTTTTQNAARGPRRIDSFGTLRTRLSRTASQETDELGACDYKALRVIDPVRNASGAVWYPQQQQVAQGFNVTFKFMITQPTVTCDYAESVSGAFVQSLHTKLYEKCTTSGGDGFAFVIRDDSASAPGATDIGFDGPGLGYGGITNSIAFEFDTVFTAAYNEPRESHVAIHTRGKSPNTAHSAASLATVALDGSVPTTSITDGQIHEVFITYKPNITSEEMFFAIESGEITGLSTALSAHTADSLGVVSVYLDDMSSPLMSVPFNIESILRDSATSGSAWVGFTAATGDLWQAVDILEWNMTSVSVS